MTEQEALAQGYQVFKGTMRVLSAEELIDLQGQDQQAAAGQEGTYAVVVFDSPTDVSGMQADGSGQTTRSAKLIGVATANKYTNFGDVDACKALDGQQVGDVDACKALDGQQVIMAAKADVVGFPSDVRLPIGEPTASESIILK